MSSSSERVIDDYILGDVLGEGGFARVHLGTHVTTGEKFALKILPKKNLDTSSSEFKQVKREIDALSALNHPNILHMKHVNWDAKYPKRDGTMQDVLLIVLELACGGELFDFLSFTGCFDESVARTYFHQLISGLKECHGQKIAHRDLKPENLLMDENYALKIADFGFAHMANSDGNVSASSKHKMTTECGTKGYMAPEILAGRPYDESADLFASAVILFIMLAGFPPFQFATKQGWWYNKIMSEKYALFWKAHERSAFFTDAAKDLINKMLAYDTSKRLTIEQIEEHEWFKGPILTAEQLKEDLGARAEKVKAEKKKEKEANKVTVKKSALVELGDYDVTRGVPFDMDGMPMINPVLGMKAMFKQAAEDMGEDQKYAFEDTGLEVFDEPMAVYTKINTTVSANAALNNVIELLNKAKMKYTVDAKNFTVKSKIGGEPMIVNDDEDEDALPQPIMEEIVFSVRVYRSPSDENQRTLVFKRSKGPAIQFQKLFDDMTSCLSIPYTA